MAFPINLDSTVPANSESPSLGAARIRAIIQNFVDLFGLPPATNITAQLMNLNAATLDGKLDILPVAKAASPFQRFIGTEASFKDVRVRENAGVFQLQVNTGSEGAPTWVTVFQWGWGANFAGIFTHTNAADRTYTLPDRNITFAGLDAQAYTGTQRWAKGADIASAGTLTPGTDGNYFQVSGTTTITAIATLSAGTLILLEFQGALTLTHNGTSLILPGAANITTAAGDTAIFVSEGAGNWRCLIYQKASGQPVNFSSIQQTVFTANGNWTVPAGVTKALIEVWGGGGGGGGGAGTSSGERNSGGGGGGGAYAWGVITVVPLAVHAVTIGTGGAGGTGGAAAGNNDGTDGGAGTTTSVGALISAGGGGAGGKGVATAIAAGAGGAGGAGGTSAATNNITGQAGTRGFGINGAHVFGGQGGSAFQSAGGPGSMTARGANNAAPAGTAGLLGSGGGGGAGGDNTNQAGANGGAGGAGLVRITYVS